MDGSREQTHERFERALALLAKTESDLPRELARRAQEIDEGRRAGKTWDAAKYEILGRLP